MVWRVWPYFCSARIWINLIWNLVLIKIWNLFAKISRKRVLFFESSRLLMTKVESCTKRKIKIGMQFTRKLVRINSLFSLKQKKNKKLGRSWSKTLSFLSILLELIFYAVAIKTTLGNKGRTLLPLKKGLWTSQNKIKQKPLTTIWSDIWSSCRLILQTIFCHFKFNLKFILLLNSFSN